MAAHLSDWMRLASADQPVKTPPSGRCAFKALADRALRAEDGGKDPFEINAREARIVLLLAEIRKSDQADENSGACFRLSII